ncbi:AMP-binding protein, partial [Klebsiella pneumoniae]|uniref:AMP-binding protein n=1 Tax=Klebsiella pneumoniae TaxID=573 RepID=UPI003EC05A1E
MQATPTLWRLIINAAPDCLAGIKVLCGGEPLDPALAQAVLSQQGNLWNMYGPTETTIWSAISHIQHSADITIGSAIANTSLYVMAEDAQSPCL